MIQLFCRGGFAIFHGVFGNANATLVTWLNGLECEGTEASLLECPSSGWGANNCQHAYDVGVICDGPESDTDMQGWYREIIFYFNVYCHPSFSDIIVVIFQILTAI